MSSQLTQLSRYLQIVRVNLYLYSKLGKNNAMHSQYKQTCVTNTKSEMRRWNISLIRTCLLQCALLDFMIYPSHISTYSIHFIELTLYENQHMTHFCSQAILKVRQRDQSVSHILRDPPTSSQLLSPHDPPTNVLSVHPEIIYSLCVN